VPSRAIVTTTLPSGELMVHGLCPETGLGGASSPGGKPPSPPSSLTPPSSPPDELALPDELPLLDPPLLDPLLDPSLEEPLLLPEELPSELAVVRADRADETSRAHFSVPPSTPVRHAEDPAVDLKPGEHCFGSLHFAPSVAYPRRADFAAGGEPGGPLTTLGAGRSVKTMPAPWLLYVRFK
jgi:hypothetical protein